MLHKRKARLAAQRYHLLRREVQGMPLGMAGAMLSSLDEKTIVAGQYTDNNGGACPLLAAWQSSQRTVKLRHTFPATWDVFCGIKRPDQARPARPHEIRMLRMLLQERLMPQTERQATPDLAPVAQPQVAPITQPAPAQLLLAEEWSCDWEAEMRQLSKGHFVRQRRLEERIRHDDVYSEEWVDHLAGLMYGVTPEPQAAQKESPVPEPAAA